VGTCGGQRLHGSHGRHAHGGADARWRLDHGGYVAAVDRSRGRQGMTRVLIVEDEAQIARAMQVTLQAHGYQAITVGNGADALNAVAKQSVNIVVLDLGLPDMDGVEIIRRIRGWSSMPIIVLSARHASEDKVEALDAGADDYVTKPFGLDELLARLRVASRRVLTDREEPTLATSDFMVDLAGKKIVKDGSEVRLTPTEW